MVDAAPIRRLIETVPNLSRLAREINVTGRTLSRIRKGQPTCSIDVADRVLLHFGRSVSELPWFWRPGRNDISPNGR